MVLNTLRIDIVVLAVMENFNEMNLNVEHIASVQDTSPVSVMKLLVI
jgi:hypothetical protein